VAQALVRSGQEQCVIESLVTWPRYTYEQLVPVL
jgi:hypothetical protein